MPGLSSEIIDFAKNKQLLEKMAKEDYQMFKNAHAKMKQEFRFSEQDFINATKDESRVQDYLRAKLVISRQDECHRLFDKYKDEGKFVGNIAKGLERHAHLLLDTSGTPEADERNIAFLNKACTREGAQEIINSELRRMMNFDVSKLYSNDPDVVFDLMENNFKEMQFLFVFKSEVDGHFTLDGDVEKFLKDNTPIFEQAGAIKASLSQMACNYYLTTPKGLTEEDILPCYSDLIDKSRERRGSGIPGYYYNPQRESIELYTEDYLNKILQEEAFKPFDAGTRKLIEEGVLDKDFLYKYKAVDSNKEITLNDGIERYGKMVMEYDKLPIAERADCTFEQFMQQKGYVNPFIERDKGDLESVKGCVQNNDFIVSDKNLLDTFDKSIADINQTVDNQKGTRSYNRNNAIKNLINDIFDDKMKIGGHKLADSPKKIMAMNARQLLIDKHNSRSGAWKFFHPFQNRAEKNAITEIEAVMTKNGMKLKELTPYEVFFKNLKNTVSGQSKNEQAPENKPLSQEEMQIGQQKLIDDLNKDFSMENQPIGNNTIQTNTIQKNIDGPNLNN